MNLKVFPIDYVRSAIMFALLKNRNNNEYFNDNDISIISFFEHLSEESEVERYVETYKQLVMQQNKENILGAGILTCTDNPTIVNNKSAFICPFEWSCTIRVKLENRDRMLGTLYKVMEEFRGKKVDIATLDNGKLQAVGTIANEEMAIVDYDYIGDFEDSIDNSELNYRIAMFATYYGISNRANVVFASINKEILKLFKFVDGVWEEVEDFIPKHENFEQMKLDISFTDIKMQQPYTLNGNDYCDIIFGGGATLTQKKIRLGNDLVKVFIQKAFVVGSPTYYFSSQRNFMLDPLEKCSGNSATSIENKLRSNSMLVNSHTDSIATTHEYTFIYDEDIWLLNWWFNYANYGDQMLNENGTLNNNSMTPNITYKITELWSSWGEVLERTYYGKIVEDIEIGNTDSDIMTIKVSMQLQGENN